MSTIPRRCLGALACAALVPLACAFDCSGSPQPPSPCEQDRLGCADTTPSDDFYLPACPDDVTGPLAVAVGTGESGFIGFDPGTGPEVHHGPQGGQHVFMAVRIANPRLDASPLVRLHFYVGQGAGCAPPAATDASATPPAATDGTVPVIAECATALGSRDLTLGAAGFEMHAEPDGSVSEWGLVVFVDVPATDVPSILAVSAEDQCHRSGVAYQAWTSY